MFDPDGVRRFALELAKPADPIHEPWRATPIELKSDGAELGRGYPAPIVDHKQPASARHPPTPGFARARSRRSL